MALEISRTGRKFKISPKLHPLLQQAMRIIQSRGIPLYKFAEHIGYNRYIFNDYNKKCNGPNLSTMIDIFDALGYDLVAVKRPIDGEATSKSTNEGKSISNSDVSIAP